LGAGGALGGPARPGGNFGGKTPNLGAAPHDWGFAKNKESFNILNLVLLRLVVGRENYR